MINRSDIFCSIIFNSDVVIWVYCSLDKSLFRLLPCYGIHLNVWRVITTNTQQRYESSNAFESSRSYRKVIWLKLNSAGKWTMRARVGTPSYGVPFVILKFRSVFMATPSMQISAKPHMRRALCQTSSKALCFFKKRLSILSLYNHWRCQSLQLNITSLSSALLWKSDATWVNLHFSWFGNATAVIIIMIIFLINWGISAKYKMHQN